MVLLGFFAGGREWSNGIAWQERVLPAAVQCCWQCCRWQCSTGAARCRRAPAPPVRPSTTSVPQHCAPAPLVHPCALVPNTVQPSNTGAPLHCVLQHHCPQYPNTTGPPQHPAPHNYAPQHHWSTPAPCTPKQWTPAPLVHPYTTVPSTVVPSTMHPCTTSAPQRCAPQHRRCAPLPAPAKAACSQTSPFLITFIAKWGWPLPAALWHGCWCRKVLWGTLGACRGSSIHPGVGTAVTPSSREMGHGPHWGHSAAEEKQPWCNSLPLYFYPQCSYGGAACLSVCVLSCPVQGRTQMPWSHPVLPQVCWSCPCRCPWHSLAFNMGL